MIFPADGTPFRFRMKSMVVTRRRLPRRSRRLHLDIPAVASREAQGVRPLARIEGVGDRAQADPAHLGDLGRIGRGDREGLARSRRVGAEVIVGRAPLNR